MTDETLADALEEVLASMGTKETDLGEAEYEMAVAALTW